MAKLSAPRKRLRKVADAVPSVTQIHAVMLALEPQENTYGDHAIALIGSGFVEKALEAAILTRFVNLTPEESKGIFSFESGPLGNLSAKIKIAFALGLFGPKTRDDLNHVREIRNSFAHSLNLLRFETEEVADLCKLLNTPSTLKFGDRFLLAVANPDAPRGRYISTTLALAGRLQGTMASAKSVRLTRRGPEIIADHGLP